MKFALLLLTISLLPIKSFALSKDNQSWNTLIFSKKLNQLHLKLETEIRYSDGNVDFFEEHIKPYIGYKTGFGEFGFVFSYLADDGLSKEYEKRYAFQYSKDLFNSPLINYSIRYRYELRDFTTQSTLAHRTRLRNQVKFKVLRLYKWTPFISSEFNFYVNDTSDGPDGFSSHRSIVGVSRSFKNTSLILSYINNYKTEDSSSNMRHILGLGAAFTL